MKSHLATEKTDPESIFRPIRVGPLEFKNRLVALPVYTGYAHPGGSVSALLIDHYTRLADSGVAVVIVANAAVASDGIGSTYNLRVDHDEFLPGLTKLARAIKGRGALSCLQLNHAGRFAKTEQPLLPSPLNRENLAFNIAALKDFMHFFPFEKRFRLTHYFLQLFSTWRQGMSHEDCQRVIKNFGDAADRAFQAGFDMIELHGANGYLLCQFLSAFTNKRESDGAEFRNRTDFPLAVIREVKDRLPPDFPVGFRLLLEEWVPGGINLEESLTWAGMLEDEGIAYISATAGTYSSIFSAQSLKKMSQPAFMRNEVAKLTSQVTVPTVISGRIIKPSLACRMVDEGVADLIGLGRSLRADFDWVKNAQKRRENEITYCINCNGCLKRVILDQGFNCTRWPRVLQEKIELDHKLLSRMFRGLWVVSDRNDLKLLKTALPLLLPDKRRLSVTITPTILFLEKDGVPPLTVTDRQDFVHWGGEMLHRLGYPDGRIHLINRVVRETFEKEVYEEVERGHHGVICLAQNRNELWRERLLYKMRGKVTALLGSNECQFNILVPVDLSPSTLLALMFIGQVFVGKPDIKLNFVHVLRGPAEQAEKRWKELQEIVSWNEDFQLQLISDRNKVPSILLDMVKNGEYGTIIMGKRGQSGIKRRLLGSVSASLLRGLNTQTLFLVD